MTTFDYISSQPENIQPLLVSVREAIKAALPDAEERISYGMPTFWKRHNLIHYLKPSRNRLSRFFPSNLNHNGIDFLFTHTEGNQVFTHLSGLYFAHVLHDLLADDSGVGDYCVNYSVADDSGTAVSSAVVPCYYDKVLK